jgi:hypothetical protein
MLDLTPVVYTHLSLAPFFQYRLHYSKSLEHELGYNVYKLGFFSCWKTLCTTHEHKHAPASLASKQTEEKNQNRGVQQSKGCRPMEGEKSKLEYHCKHDLFSFGKSQKSDVHCINLGLLKRWTATFAALSSIKFS